MIAYFLPSGNLFGDNHLRIFAIRVGALHCSLHAIGQGHAVPHAVEILAVQLIDLHIPVDDHEFHLNAQLLSHQLGHVGVKADPLIVFILIVHRCELGDTNHQLTLS